MMSHARTASGPLGQDGLTSVQRALRDRGIQRGLTAGDELSRETLERCVGFVLHGQLTLTWHQDAKRSGIDLLLPGDWFGEHNLLLGAAPAALHLSANGFAQVLTVRADELRGLLEGELALLREPLQRELSASLTERWMQLASRLHQRMHLGTDACVWAALHEAASWPSAMSHPEGTLVKIPRQHIAQRIGCSRVTVSRALSRLAAAGRIRLEGRRILLLGHQGRSGDAPAAGA
jgi:CRP/FNR family cyclic AMP-dependent transcriptional regulator